VLIFKKFPRGEADAFPEKKVLGKTNRLLSLL
jgi:hypothetical protein